MSAFGTKRTSRSHCGVNATIYGMIFVMDGVHDMGGMDGFGKVEVEKNEPVFHATWEGHVLAMALAMQYAGAWRIDHSRFAQEQLPPITYLSASYYKRWALGMEKTSSSAASRQPRNSRQAMPQVPVRYFAGSSQFQCCRIS